MNRIGSRRGSPTREPRNGSSGAGRPPSADRVAASHVGEPLPKAAGRLLPALALPEAFAVPDPTEPDAVIVRSVRNGVSLGAGRFPSNAAEALVRSDLATWSDEASAGRLRLSAVGRA